MIRQLRTITTEIIRIHNYQRKTEYRIQNREESRAKNPSTSSMNVSETCVCLLHENSVKKKIVIFSVGTVRRRNVKFFEARVTRHLWTKGRKLRSVVGWIAYASVSSVQFVSGRALTFGRKKRLVKLRGERFVWNSRSLTVVDTPRSLAGERPAIAHRKQRLIATPRDNNNCLARIPVPPKTLFRNFAKRLSDAPWHHRWFC